MKQKNHNQVLRLTIVVLLILIFATRFLLSNRFSLEYGELIFLIIVGLSMLFLYNLFKKKYSGMCFFFTLSFLLIGLFPFLHYLCYSSNRNNYSFNTDYLNQRVLVYKQELKYYKDSTEIKELFNKVNKTEINLKLDYSFIGKKQTIGEYTFILNKFNKKWYQISGLPRPPNYPEGTTNKFEIYKGNKKFNFEIINDDLKSEVIYFLRQKKQLENKIKKPKQFVPFSDIWLDSVTGFIFAFIKPLSKVSQIIRIFQLIVAYFLFHMISSWIKQSKGLNIEKIEKDYS
jgi:hypothetical protein